MLIGLAFIWGTSFILMKRGLESFTSYQVAAFRIFISFVIMIPLIIRHVKKITKKNIKSLLIVGFIGNCIPAFFFTTAQTQITSSLAGILNSLTPIFTMVIGVLLYRSKVFWVNILGLLIGLFGAAGLIVKDISDFFIGNNWYALFVVAATLCYGINVNEVKYKLEDLSGVAIAALGFLFTGPVTGIYLLFSDYSATVATDNYMMNLGYIVILALFSSVIAVIGINILIKYTTTIFAASVTYIIPVFAIFWGMFDGEKFYTIDIFWIILVLLGVYLVNKSH